MQCKKNHTDKLKVPVVFMPTKTADGFISMETPGPLYTMSNDFSALDRIQYSDMSNGSYYLLTRVKTHASFIDVMPKEVLKKVDSLLYENIPGRILKKTFIQKDGYPGYNIINRTRRGDLQRYQVFATPFEVLVFKMGGKENYIEGQEGARFFNSIHLRPIVFREEIFSPPNAGFEISLPAAPQQKLAREPNGAERWEYESMDPAGSASFLILKKTLSNNDFIEEDTFNLGLMEESFRLSSIFEKQISRQMQVKNGRPVLNMVLALKSGGVVRARMMINGPHSYLLAARYKDAEGDAESFFNSFRVTPYAYGESNVFTDSFLRYSVKSPVVPVIDGNLREIVERYANDNLPSANQVNYWPKMRSATYRSDSTGEEISVTLQQYPKYFYVKDSLAFWEEEADDYTGSDDLVVLSKDSFNIPQNKISGYSLLLGDTNSTRIIQRLFLLQGESMYRIVQSRDSLQEQSAFSRDFFASFMPSAPDSDKSIFQPKLDLFVRDFQSTDSLTQALAFQAIQDVYYGEEGLPKLMALLNQMQYGRKQYFENKSRLIAELGYIREPNSAKAIAGLLRDIYYRSGDTGVFQNEVFRALAKQRTKESYALIKEFILQDPPLFESNFEYGKFFYDLEDSLSLTKKLFPDILQLLTIEDYEERVTKLLIRLVDSGYLRARDYESYFNKFYFDARVKLKKQQAKDEKVLQRKTSSNENDEPAYFDNSYKGSKIGLEDYALLLMPFYDKKNSVPPFFEKLLSTLDENLQLKTLAVLVNNKKNVPDSLIWNLASADRSRAELYKILDKAGTKDKFPAKFYSQVDFARSALVMEKKSSRIDSISLIKKQVLTFRKKRGNVYFFRYRVNKDDDFKIGISGMQPIDPGEINYDGKLVKMTDKKIREDEPLEEQLQEQLKRLIFSLHKSSRIFYRADNFSRFRD